MKATEILMSEHEVILGVISAMQTAAWELEQGMPIRPSFFLDAADFIAGFADGCHHKKEENVLFVAMAENGVPVQGGPIGMMLAEHEQGRAYTRALRAAALRLESGDLTARNEVVNNARGYAHLLEQHIGKENLVLFPMADRFIPPDEHEKVAQDFERVEHEETGEGIHEKYLALAQKLHAETSGS
jgi:hemerythrin-like domain-containing protein